MNTLGKIRLGTIGAYLKAKSLILKNSNAIKFVLVGLGILAVVVLLTIIEIFLHPQIAGSFIGDQKNTRESVFSILSLIEPGIIILVAFVIGLSSTIALGFRAYRAALLMLAVAAGSYLFVLGIKVQQFLDHNRYLLSHSQSSVGKFTEANCNAFYWRAAVSNILGLIEGPFCPLMMIVAGLGAIIAAAFRSYKRALLLLVVVVEFFILSSLISLFFGNNFFAVVGSSQVNPGAGNFGGGGQIQN